METLIILLALLALVIVFCLTAIGILALFLGRERVATDVVQPLGDALKALVGKFPADSSHAQDYSRPDGQHPPPSL